MRRIAVWLHRWAGLALAGPLILVGLTGSLLAYNQSLERLLAPRLFPAQSQGQQLLPGNLAARLEEQVPGTQVAAVFMDNAGAARLLATAPRREENQAVLDTVTGQVRGWRSVGGWPTSLAEVMPFVYRFHYSLAAGDWGHLVLGWVAFIWTLDCFSALYLTLPTFNSVGNRRNWWTRWIVAWRIRWRKGPWKVVFDLHRAGGLCLWVMMLMFAWSSVGFNLNEQVYRPAMGLAFDMGPNGVPEGRATGQPMGWLDAQRHATSLLQDLESRGRVSFVRPVAMFREPEAHRFQYLFHSNRDIGENGGDTWLVFDDRSGGFLQLRLPTGEHGGVTVASWLTNLHEANVFGSPYRLLVFLSGIVLVMLGATGVWIWWVKRTARRKSGSKLRREA